MAGNALPILLIGGAAALMLAGKKKKAPSAPAYGDLALPPTTPPPLPKSVKTSGSGYPGVSRSQMQEIQTMLVANGYDVGQYGLDGKYGPATKQAVWEFQEDWGGGLVVDGKPGPKTQAALKEAESQRLYTQQTQAKAQPQQAAKIVDECDPLNPGTWGSGNVCVLDGGRWVRKKAQAKPPAKPQAKPPSPTGKSSPQTLSECIRHIEYTWEAWGGYSLRDGSKEGQYRHLYKELTSIGWGCDFTAEMTPQQLKQFLYDFATNKGDAALAQYIQEKGFS